MIQYTLNNTENSSPSTAKNPTTIKLASVKPLIKISEPLGVCAGRCHAVLWNKHAIYTWGSNLGQLGHPEKDKIISAPKRVRTNIIVAKISHIFATKFPPLLITCITCIILHNCSLFLINY